VLARTRAISILNQAGERARREQARPWRQNMRVHFQQLTEPIAPLVDDDHKLFEFALDPFASQILTPPQSKSHAPRSRRLQMPRACGDPIRSSLVTA
jgi:hypothetical protein